jgi:hypothetical protein
MNVQKVVHHQQPHLYGIIIAAIIVAHVIIHLLD